MRLPFGVGMCLVQSRVCTFLRPRLLAYSTCAFASTWHLKQNMASSSDEYHSWSDTSGEDEVAGVTPIQPRSYQIEMFEQSLQGNIIAVVTISPIILQHNHSDRMVDGYRKRKDSNVRFNLFHPLRSRFQVSTT